MDKKNDCHHSSTNFTCILCLDDIIDEKDEKDEKYEKDENNNERIMTSCCQRVLFHKHCEEKWIHHNFLNVACPWCRSPTTNETSPVYRAYHLLVFAIYNMVNKKEDGWYDDPKGFFKIFCRHEDHLHMYRIRFRNELYFEYWYDVRDPFFATYHSKFIFGYPQFLQLFKNQGFKVQRHSLVKENQLIAEATVV